MNKEERFYITEEDLGDDDCKVWVVEIRDKKNNNALITSASSFDLTRARLKADEKFTSMKLLELTKQDA